MIESHRVAVAGTLLLGMLVAGGCAAPSRIEVPSVLPNTTQEQFLTL